MFDSAQLVALFQVIAIDIVLAGGILLLWVCWKMYRDIKAASHAMEPAYAGGSIPGGSEVKTITFSAALIQIVIADASMSLDNVLAVAGAAKGDMIVLVIGLTVAVAFMALSGLRNRSYSRVCSTASAPAWQVAAGTNWQPT